MWLLAPSEEQSVFLTAEPSLQPPICSDDTEGKLTSVSIKKLYVSTADSPQLSGARTDMSLKHKGLTGVQILIGRKDYEWDV